MIHPVRRVLIANPWASGVDEERLASVRAALPEGTELRLTSVRGEATALAHEIAGRVDVLYVFGGDGTYNEVLNGIDATTPLGFIPGGGTSVLPRALGLPREPVAAARQLVARARPRQIAVGRVNGHRFGFASGIGLDAEVVRAVDALGRRSDGRRPGNLAFAWTGVRTLSRHRYRLDPALEVKGFGRVAFALVQNGPAYTYAGPVALQPAPEASFEGGLDLVAPMRVRARNLPRIARYALGSRDSDGDFIRVHDADRLELVCDRPLALQADGEDLGDVEFAVFEAERAAVTVLA
ncbi:MAG TPA: diacylglycerol kinase family protein [Gaiellaceae bacterium]|nr:diacylglycerol kinase family protein [Gaiellaceae bacterium]